MPKTIELADPTGLERGTLIEVVRAERQREVFDEKGKSIGTEPEGYWRVRIMIPGDPEGEYVADEGKLLTVTLQQFIDALIEDLKLARGYTK